MTVLAAALGVTVGWLLGAAWAAALLTRVIDRRDHPKPVIPAQRRELHHISR